MRDQEATFLHPLDDKLARAIDTIAFEAVEAEIFGRDQPIGGLDHIRVAIEHVEHLAGLESCALADLEIVEIMTWRYFHRARTQFGIGMFVGDNGNAAD